MSALSRRRAFSPSLVPTLPDSAIILPPRVEQAIWHGTDLGSACSTVVPTGFAALDAVLPGGGWPCRSLTDILQAQPSVLEWRLLGPALRTVVQEGQTVVVVGPPKEPHMMGLRHIGMDEHHFVWIKADTPAHRLWVTEQLVKSNSCGALVCWLPQARPEQLRRLQVCAHGCDAPVFLFRPETVAVDACAAPLRLQVSFGADWELAVRVLKRRGSLLEEVLRLPSVPGGLDPAIAPRARKPSVLLPTREATHALGRTAVADYDRSSVVSH